MQVKMIRLKTWQLTLQALKNISEMETKFSQSKSHGITKGPVLPETECLRKGQIFNRGNQNE